MNLEPTCKPRSAETAHPLSFDVPRPQKGLNSLGIALHMLQPQAMAEQKT